MSGQPAPSELPVHKVLPEMTGLQARKGQQGFKELLALLELQEQQGPPEVLAQPVL